MRAWGTDHPLPREQWTFAIPAAYAAEHAAGRSLGPCLRPEAGGDIRVAVFAGGAIAWTARDGAEVIRW